MSWSMNVNALKIWYQSNPKKIVCSWIKKCTYLAVNKDGGTKRQKKENYDLQCSNDKIMMTITIITNRMSMHCSIKMYKPKQFYKYKRNNLNCHFYNNDCFNNKECGFKVNILVEMWMQCKYGISIIVRKLSPAE